MRSNFIIIGSPGIGSAASFEDRHEPMHVEELVPDLTVERFDAAVLSRLTGSDEVQLDVSPGCPAQHRVARELGTVVKSNRLGQLAVESDPFELPDDVSASQ